MFPSFIETPDSIMGLFVPRAGMQKLPITVLRAWKLSSISICFTGVFTYIITTRDVVGGSSPLLACAARRKFFSAFGSHCTLHQWMVRTAISTDKLLLCIGRAFMMLFNVCLFYWGKSPSSAILDPQNCDAIIHYCGSQSLKTFIYINLSCWGVDLRCLPFLSRQYAVQCRTDVKKLWCNIFLLQVSEFEDFHLHQ